MIVTVVTVYRRHSKICPQKDNRYSRKCDCPAWLQYQHNGKQRKITAGTRSWERAELRARDIERGAGAPSVEAAPLMLVHAINRYLDAISDPKLRRKSIQRPKRMMKLLGDFCYLHKPPVEFVRDITPMLLEEWRSTWTFKAYSSSPKMHDSAARAFFKWCHDMELIMRNPYQNLSRYKSVDPQTMPLTPTEVQAILDAIETLPKITAEMKYKVRGLVLLQRWSGLAITDALTLSRTALHSDNSIELRRTKTGEAVVTSVPPEVADHLRMMPNEHAGYFFWDGVKDRKTMLNAYSDILRSTFDAAGVSRDQTKGGMTLSHRFRDTFSVEFLATGEPMENLSMILGHSNIATTEKYYACWVPARKELLRQSSERSVKAQLPVGLEPVQFKEEVLQ